MYGWYKHLELTRLLSDYHIQYTEALLFWCSRPHCEKNAFVTLCGQVKYQTHPYLCIFTREMRIFMDLPLSWTAKEYHLDKLSSFIINLWCLFHVISIHLTQSSSDHEQSHKLVISTHLKNISQNGSFPQIGVKWQIFETTNQSQIPQPITSFISSDPAAPLRRLQRRCSCCWWCRCHRWCPWWRMIHSWGRGSCWFCLCAWNPKWLSFWLDQRRFFLGWNKENEDSHIW